MPKTSWVFSTSAHSVTMHDLQMQNCGSQTNLNDNLLGTDTHVSSSSQVNVQMASMVLSSDVCSNELMNVVPPYFQSSDRQQQFLIQIFMSKLTDTECMVVQLDDIVYRASLMTKQSHRRHTSDMVHCWL